MPGVRLTRLVIFIFGLSTSSLFAQSPDAYFQSRRPDETVDQAYRRFVGGLEALGVDLDAGLRDKNGYDNSVLLKDLDLSAIKPWAHSKLTLDEFFVSVRDERFIKDPKQKDFLRRPTWLYPDAGCHTRAAMFNLKLQGTDQPLLAKVYAFGDLLAKTPNRKTGAVTWWWHAVVATRVGEEVFVLDPAVEPMRPLTFSEWVSSIAPYPDKLQIAICSERSYAPTDPCLVGEHDRRAISDQVHYLKFEWDRMIELKRDPLVVLGDAPPWLPARTL